MSGKYHSCKLHSYCKITYNYHYLLTYYYWDNYRKLQMNISCEGIHIIDTTAEHLRNVILAH